MIGTGPCLGIINSLISELWTPDVSCQIPLEIHKFVTDLVRVKGGGTCIL